MLIEKINGLFSTFQTSIKLAIQKNLPNRNVLAETTLAGLLNRIHGWDLLNANTYRQNFPGVDLVDKNSRIAVQVTSTNELDKVDNTTEKFTKYSLGRDFDRLIILIITTDRPTRAMSSRSLPPVFSGGRDIWNMNTLFGQIESLSIEKLEEIQAYLETEVGTVYAKVNGRNLCTPLHSVVGEGFVGREKELEEIGRSLAAGTKPVVLSGLGGIGKTELALRFGRNYRGGGVYFVRFRESFFQTIASMAAAIQPAIDGKADDRQRYDTVIQLLRELGEDDLLIIDNVDAGGKNYNALTREEEYKSLLQMNLRLLLTTRSEVSRGTGISRMENEDLYRIFENHGARLKPETMDSLIAAVNGHTITVDLIARTLADNWTPVKPEDMLAALADDTLPEADFGEIDADYAPSPEQVQIYQHLRQVFQVAKVPPAEQDILRCATLLPEGGMDVKLFRAALTEEIRKAFPDLGRSGWLSAENGLLTIHPVVRLVCRTELKPTDENCREFLDALWDQFDPNVYDTVKFTQLAEVFSVATDQLEDQEAKWINKSGYFMLHLGQYNAARSIYKKHLPNLEVRLKDTNRLASVFNNLGSIYGYLGDYKRALEYQLNALKIREKILPPDHLNLADSYNNVGCIYDDLGDHEKALEYKLKDLAICEKVLPPEHPTLATSYSNVGSTYDELGDHNKALEYKLKALEIQEKVLPAAHPSLATTYNNLGCTYGKLGNLEKELEFQLKALQTLEQVLPENHPTLASSYNNVGITYLKMGRFSDALEKIQQALAIYKKSLPDGHPHIMDSQQGVELLELLVELAEAGIDPQELLNQLK